MDGDSTETNDDKTMTGSAYLRCYEQGGRAFFAFQPLFCVMYHGTINKGDHGYVK